MSGGDDLPRAVMLGELVHGHRVDGEGRVVGYALRQRDPKRQSVIALHSLYYRVISAGDSYNDTTMLAESDAGILFMAPKHGIAEVPQFPAVDNYGDLKKAVIQASERDLEL